MDLISLAVPFFLLAILVEIWVDRRRGTGYIPMADAISSLSAGAMSTITGIFSKLVGIAVYGLTLQHLSIVTIPLEWFDASLRGVSLWLLALVCWDFCYYWKHRLGHEISIFWAAHSVHHQSEEYNLTTALRQTSTDFLIGWIVYVPLFLLGMPLHVFITVSAVDLIYQFWVHTRHIDKLGWADYIFVTPSNHRVHHAQNARYIDKNYGGILIIWDRLFGTFEPENDADPVVFGVRKPLASFNPWQANLKVYKDLWRDSRLTHGLRNRWRLWFGRTGWRPADAANAYPITLTPLERFQKYRPQHAPVQRAYLIFQFAAVLLLTLGMPVAFQGINTASASAAATVCLLLIGIGLVNDDSRWALSFERARLLLLIATAVLIGANLPARCAVWVGVAVGIYTLLSIVLLSRAGLSDRRVVAGPS
ncbi:MAG: sterol desaturase family protein [Pseudomonadota bacterium]